MVGAVLVLRGGGVVFGVKRRKVGPKKRSIAKVGTVQHLGFRCMTGFAPICVGCKPQPSAYQAVRDRRERLWLSWGYEIFTLAA